MKQYASGGIHNGMVETEQDKGNHPNISRIKKTFTCKCKRKIEAPGAAALIILIY